MKMIHQLIKNSISLNVKWIFFSYFANAVNENFLSLIFRENRGVEKEEETNTNVNGITTHTHTSFDRPDRLNNFFPLCFFYFIDFSQLAVFPINSNRFSSSHCVLHFNRIYHYSNSLNIFWASRSCNKYDTYYMRRERLRCQA